MNTFWIVVIGALVIYLAYTFCLIFAQNRQPTIDNGIRNAVFL